MLSVISWKYIDNTITLLKHIKCVLVYLQTFAYPLFIRNEWK